MIDCTRRILLDIADSTDIPEVSTEASYLAVCMESGIVPFEVVRASVVDMLSLTVDPQDCFMLGLTIAFLQGADYADGAILER